MTVERYRKELVFVLVLNASKNEEALGKLIAGKAELTSF